MGLFQKSVHGSHIETSIKYLKYNPPDPVVNRFALLNHSNALVFQDMHMCEQGTHNEIDTVDIVSIQAF